ncbi:MAG: S41 family peptidase [Bacteroidota bacterium]
MKRIIKITGIIAVLLVAMATTIGPNNNKYFEIIKNIEIFTNLYREINTYYVDEIDPGKLMRTGIDAMMESLDPYTNYISESDIEGYRFYTEGRYNGIGAVSRKMGEYVVITDLYEDQPADQAGLKVGDKIIAVEGENAKGKNPEQINNFLRGVAGTPVQITIERPGSDKQMDIELIRGEVKVPNVPYYGMVDDKVGYIVLTTFTQNASRNIANAYKELQKDHPDLQGIILDLRNNGGGLLNEAVNICNIFIPKGEVIVKTKGKVKDWDMSFKTLRTPIDTEIPLAVLINKNSASASEIVSGVVQDYDRGILIGQRSYGKGLVQNTKDIGYNAKLKLTTAKYYIPSERCIQSVEYKDGEPVNIPDSKRAPFKTRNGRTVLDGGGVKPDVVLTKPTDGGVIKSLIDQHLIFDYVTNYCLKYDSIAPVEEFQFTDFDGFIKFVESRNFEYVTATEKNLEKLQQSLQKDGYQLTDEVATLQAKIQEAKTNELITNKAIITNLIEKEIAGRYYYQNGRLRIGLENDMEIDEAVDILKDQKRYEGILGPE